ncbi:ATP-binding cassette domain-containing protein [Candidatus Woesearchaeota archaeon]|nr:ATP-binding cassette domain-containing protein [Candidatus Woesearchaeota archaeon]
MTNDKIHFKENLNIYFGLLRNYKWHAAGLVLFILYIEATFTIDRFLFKILIDEGTKFTAGTIEAASYTTTLFWLLIAYAIFAGLRGIVKWLHMHLLARLDSGLMRDLKRKYFNHILHLSTRFHTSNKTGSLISRLIRGSGAVERMTDVFVFNGLPLLFSFAVVVASLFYFDALSAIIACVVVFTFVTYSWFINKMQEPANLVANDQEDREKGTIADFFTNIDSIKYFGKEKRIKKIYSKISENTKRALVHNWDYFRWLDSGQTTILSIGTLLILISPVFKLLSGEITIGTVVFIYTVYSNLIGPMFSFVHGIRNFYRSMADFESLFQYGRVTNEIKDRKDAPQLNVKKGTISFENVTFKYHNRPILKNFTLEIPRNYKVALVGPSGAGKSTIVKLLYRLYDINDGRITIDGKDISKVRQESLRGELSIVPQECILFDDTIYNNIAFSRKRATREEIFRAIKFAQLDKIIKHFPHKEKTIVGERGVKLSGGEKQRVSIARALLANKKILVLDEATSALDSETEHEIQQDLERLMQGRTSIIIAHRLSTIMKADNIVVMDKGQIVQQGTHNELIRKPGIYKKLWNLQKGGYV